MVQNFLVKMLNNSDLGMGTVCVGFTLGKVNWDLMNVERMFSELLI